MMKRLHHHLRSHSLSHHFPLTSSIIVVGGIIRGSGSGWCSSVCTAISTHIHTGEGTSSHCKIEKFEECGVVLLWSWRKKKKMKKMKMKKKVKGMCVLMNEGKRGIQTQKGAENETVG